jgi:hypothetical protein
LTPVSGSYFFGITESTPDRHPETFAGKGLQHIGNFSQKRWRAISG